MAVVRRLREHPAWASHAALAAYGLLGLTTWRTQTFEAAGTLGVLLSVTFIVLGIAGAWYAYRGRALFEITTLHAQAWTLLVAVAMAVAWLPEVGFARWQGVVPLVALAAAQVARARTLRHGLSLVGAIDRREEPPDRREAA